MIPYTHWMFFDDRADADRCAAELTAQQFLCLVEFSPQMTPQEIADLNAQMPMLAGIESGPPPGDRWLLRAAKKVDDTIARHQMVSAIVQRHGGTYDDGETGWLPPGGAAT